jgi:ABC-type sugar transport system substrate-binding protein
MRWWRSVRFWKYAAPAVAFVAVATATEFLLRPKPVIVVILPSPSNPYWVEVSRAADQAALQFPQYDIVIRSSLDMDSSSQIQLLKGYLSQNRVKALVVGPANDSEPVPVIAEYSARGIPIIVIDTALNAQESAQHQVAISAFIGSDNVDGGRKAAHTIATSLRGKGSKRVLLIEGSLVHQSAIDRATGFQQVAVQENLEVVTVNGEWKRDKAHDLVLAQFSRRHFDAIFASNDDMALGAVSALKERGTLPSDWPIIVGFDATRDGLTEVANGEMYATIKQNAADLGDHGVEDAVKAIRGDPTLLSVEMLPVTVQMR